MDWGLNFCSRFFTTFWYVISKKRKKSCYLKIEIWKKVKYVFSNSDCLCDREPFTHWTQVVQDNRPMFHRTRTLFVTKFNATVYPSTASLLRFNPTSSFEVQIASPFSPLLASASGINQSARRCPVRRQRREFRGCWPVVCWGDGLSLRHVRRRSVYGRG